MAGTVLSLCQPAAYGCNTADEPIVFTEGNAGKFVQLTGNLRIHNNRWRTAYRWRELTGYGPDVELWQAGHTQAAMWYLPRTGQGSHYLGVGNPRIIDSTAGRLFSLEPKNDTFEVKDLSGGNVAYPHLMLAWLTKGENYLIRTDGRSQTQIYDGKNPVFFSKGYSSNDPTSSFPNRAGPTVYAGGRFWTTLFGRRVYVGNSLHQVNQRNASDLLKFGDQTYDYINVYFAPPGDDGDILAMTVSVDSGNRDSRGQGEVMCFCDGPSIWAVQLGIPRNQWPAADMRHPRSKETAPSGPNAFHVRDGDIMMRTTKGIEAMNLLARERNTLGNPALDLGADMKAILHRDDEQLLLFASLINPAKWDRLFCTVAPMVKGARHFHLGYITANFNPLGTRIPQGFAWEGLSTLPPKMGRIVQFLPVRIEGRSEVYAVLDKGDSKGLAQMTTEEGDHVFADRTTARVQWFIQTKRLSTGGSHRDSVFNNAWLKLDEMKTDIEIEVWARTSQHLQYKLCRSIAVKAVQSQADVFGCATRAEKRISLGAIISDMKGYSWAQFLLKGRGVCTVDFSMRCDPAGEPGEKADPECLEAESRPPCEFDPFYSALAES